MRIYAIVETQSSAIVRQFDINASLIRGVLHPHILAIHDYWQQEHNLYFVTPDVGNKLCHDKLWQDRPLALVSVTRLVGQMTSALSTLHQHHIIHRDIKPCHIYLSATGDYYLGGFEQILFHPPNDPNVLVGTLNYIAPELLRGEMVTFQTEMYSLGVVIWEALTDEKPFATANLTERLYKTLTEPLPIINTVSNAVNAVIQKATAKNPEERYTDMQEFGAAFAEASKSENT